MTTPDNETMGLLALSAYAASNKNQIDLDGWEVDKELSSDTWTGFAAVVYRKGSQVVPDVRCRD